MGDDYPRLLVDRDVAVIRDGQVEQTRLRGWLDGHDGPIPAYRIELVIRLGNYTCPYTATGPDAFEALVRLRRQLEPDGLMVAVQGARRDTYPSGMARDMGGGMQVYILRPGVPGRPDLVKTLDDAPPEQVRPDWAVGMASVTAEPVTAAREGQRPIPDSESGSDLR